MVSLLTQKHPKQPDLRQNKVFTMVPKSVSTTLTLLKAVLYRMLGMYIHATYRQAFTNFLIATSFVSAKTLTKVASIK